MNYAELTQSIQEFAVDAEAVFIAQIPNFVRATEKRIYIDADLPVTQFEQPLTLVTGTADVPMPAEFLSVDSLWITVGGRQTMLTPKSSDFLREAYPDVYPGTPRYFAAKDPTTLTLAPTPDGNYVGHLEYFGYPESIVTAGTTWLGDNFSNALLYGSLRDAAVFLKEEADVVEMYNNQYGEALGQVKKFGAARSRLDRTRRRS